MLGEQGYQRVLWILVALSFPSFAVSFLRVDVGMMHIPYPLLGIGLILAGWICSLSLRPDRLRGVVLPLDFLVLGLLCFLFLIWHLASVLFFGEQSALAIKQLIKLAAGVGLFWAIVLLFPRDPQFLERFWRIVFWSSVLLLGYLIYRSVSEGNRFLSALNNFEDPTITGGRNQVGWYVAIVVQFAFLAFLQKGRRLVVLVPLAVISFSLVYALSRTGWIVATVGLLFVPLTMIIVDVRKAAKMFVVIVVVFLLLAVVGTWVISQYADVTELVAKFIWFFRPEEVPEYDSVATRWRRVRTALEGFTESPIVGLGLQSSLTNPGETHNDYASILVQLGLIGELLFLGILFNIGKICLGRPRFIRETSWPSMASRGAFLGLLIGSAFMDMYTIPHYWAFAGLFVVGRKVEELQLAARGIHQVRMRLRPTAKESTTPSSTVTAPNFA